MSEFKGEGTLLEQMEALVGDWEGSIERRYCHLANAAALLWQHLERVNWVGFYVRMPGREHLVLGPFQGKVACTDIAFSRGVCGRSATTRESVLVDDVHQFVGHIACDGASLSELVVPILDGEGNLVALLDMDSPYRKRFSPEDQRMGEAVASLLGARLWS